MNDHIKAEAVMNDVYDYMRCTVHEAVTHANVKPSSEQLEWPGSQPTAANHERSQPAITKGDLDLVFFNASFKCMPVRARARVCA